MTERKKRITAMIVPMLVCLAGILGLVALCVREYRRSAFEHLSAFCERMVDEAPEMETVVLASMKRYHDGLKYGTAGDLPEAFADGQRPLFLEQYGYRSEEFVRGLPVNMAGVFVAVTVLVVSGFTFAAWYLHRADRARTAELTEYLEKINTGGTGTVLVTKEDKFSHLQDEMYKTVTELYRTRQEAVVAKRNYADNLANIAHQLKTPITAAFLSLRMMEEPVGEPDSIKGTSDMRVRQTQERCASQIRKQLERLNRLEETLLTLSKIDAGVLEMERVEVDLYTVLNLAADNLDDLLSQKGVSVSVPDKGCAVFWGDMEWTMEALMNLMKNCMEHSPCGGIIHCDYSVNPLYAKIQIWDEGTGFARQDLPHLFERFYRGFGAPEEGEEGERKGAGREMAGTQRTGQEPQGAGIGLSLARAVIELQNGTVTARNLPEGGACFEIKFYSH